MGTTTYRIKLPWGTLHPAQPEQTLEVVAETEDDPGPMGDGVVAFLLAIDPDELERVALLREDIDAHGGLTGAMLRQLIEWASGA